MNVSKRLAPAPVLRGVTITLSVTEASRLRVLLDQYTGSRHTIITAGGDLVYAIGDNGRSLAAELEHALEETNEN